MSPSQAAAVLRQRTRTRRRKRRRRGWWYAFAIPSFFFSPHHFLAGKKRDLELEPGEPTEKSKRIPEIPLIIYLHMIIVKILKEKCLFFF